MAQFEIPSRSSTNQLYVPELDRIVLRSSLKSRPFAGTASVRKTTITTRVMELIHEVFLFYLKLANKTFNGIDREKEHPYHQA
jgi:hypothetical protein